MQTTYLICNYNYGKYLNGCIQSALQQTRSSAICIIDDCSTDGSWEFLNQSFKITNEVTQDKGEYIVKRSKESNAVVLIKIKQQKGPSFARNCGILETRDTTDIYAILDADDENYPTKIEKCIQPFQDPRIGVVYADYDILNMDTGNLIREYKEPYNYYRLRQECIVHSGSLIRKEALDKVTEHTGWYDINLRCCEDYDLWLRISEHYIIRHIPESLSLVRNHQQNSTHSVNKDVWNKCWQIVSQKLKVRDARKR